MWKAAVFVFLLLNTNMEVNGAVDKARGSVAVKADSIPSSHVASSPFSGNLLVVPMDGSHWVGIKAIAEEMGRRGHRVTVVIPEINMRMGPGEHYDTLTYPVPYDKALIDSVMATHKDIMQKSAQSFMEKISKRFSQIQKITSFIHTTAESLLFNASLISHLAQQVSVFVQNYIHIEMKWFVLWELAANMHTLYCKVFLLFCTMPVPFHLFALQGYDAVLTDPMVPTGSLIARKLGECCHRWIIYKLVDFLISCC